MLIVLAALSLVVSFAGTRLVLEYALRRQVLDRPTDRSSHSVPTPRGGGLAIVIAIVLALVGGAFTHVIATRDALVLASGATVLGALGWADDHASLAARTRLAVHLAVAIGTLWAYGGLPTLRVGEATLAIGGLGYVLGTIAIVWSINLFNFMDGIDGLAGSQSVLIFGSAALLLITRGALSLGAVAAVIAAASAGFLVWNWPPAKIFLGDVGSGAIGYLAAAVALASERTTDVPLLAFAILGGVFVADATVTLARRSLRGDRLAEAHRDHAYQRLTRAWGTHRAVTVAAGAVTALLAMLAVIATAAPRWMLICLVSSYALLVLLLAGVERRAPFGRAEGAPS